MKQQLPMFETQEIPMDVAQCPACGKQLLCSVSKWEEVDGGYQIADGGIGIYCRTPQPQDWNKAHGWLKPCYMDRLAQWDVLRTAVREWFNTHYLFYQSADDHEETAMEMTLMFPESMMENKQLLGLEFVFPLDVVCCPICSKPVSVCITGWHKDTDGDYLPTEIKLSCCGMKAAQGGQVFGWQYVTDHFYGNIQFDDGESVWDSPTNAVRVYLQKNYRIRTFAAIPATAVKEGEV